MMMKAYAVRLDEISDGFDRLFNYIMDPGHRIAAQLHMNQILGRVQLKVDFFGGC